MSQANPSGAFDSGNQGNGDVIINDTSSSQALPQLGVPPPTYVREINKLANTVISSATIALIRSLIYRPTAAASAAEAAEKLPAWFASEYRVQSVGQAFLRQYGRDTLALTGAAYLMGGVEHVVRGARGKDDPVNKMIGGVAAGGLLGVMWYPRQPSGRATMTAAGALVGYITFVYQKTLEQVLLSQQKVLEKDVLHKADDEVRKDLDQYYLRDLVLLKQKQVREQQLQGQAPGGYTPSGTLLQTAAEERRGWPKSGSGSSSSDGAESDGSGMASSSGSWGSPGGLSSSDGAATDGDGSCRAASGDDALPRQARPWAGGGATRTDSNAPNSSHYGIQGAGSGGSSGAGGMPGREGQGSGSASSWQRSGSGKKWDAVQEQHGKGNAPWLVINDEGGDTSGR